MRVSLRFPGRYTIQAASGDDQFEESSGSKDHVVVAPSLEPARSPLN